MTAEVSSSLSDTLESLIELADQMEKNYELEESHQSEPEETTGESEAVLHICDKCAFQSEEIVDFIEHVLYESHLMTCIRCPSKFKNASQLNKHYRSNHKDVQGVQCDDCKFKAESKELLHTHKFSIHLSNVYACNSCNQYYSMSTRFCEHIQSHKEPTKPRTCQKILKRNIMLEVNEEPEEFYCDQCPFVTKNRGNLALHITKQHEKSLVSSHTEQDKPSRGQEMRLENKAFYKQYFCNRCSFVTNSYKQLSIHTAKEHDESFMSKEQIVSGRNFKSLEGHKIICDICRIGFRNISSLNRHKKLQHETVPNIQCEHCDYKAKTKSRVKEHTDNVHNKVRHFCEHCDFSSYRKYGVKVHKKVAHGQ